MVRIASASAPIPPEGQLTVAQVARRLQVEELTVRRWISAGELRAYRYGPRAIRIDPADLKRMRRPVTPLADRREAVEAVLEEQRATALNAAVQRRLGGAAS